MTLPTASRLALAEVCLGAALLPRVRYESTEAMAAGTGRHRFLERAREVGRDAALAEIPADAPWRATCEALDLVEIPEGRHEVAYAFDPATGVAREIGAAIGRDYADALDTEIVGTADLIAPPTDDRPRWLVIDFKGREAVTAAADNLQLGFYALCAASVADVPEVDVAIVYIREDGSLGWDRAELSPWDLSALGRRLGTLAARLTAADEGLSRGRMPTLRVGPHCARCPALTLCPAQTQIAVEVLRETSGLTAANCLDGLPHLSDEDAGAALTRLEGAAELIGLQVSALRERAKIHGLPLPDGSTLMPIESTRRDLITDKAIEVLRARFGEQVDAAIERSLPSGIIAKLARQIAPKKGHKKATEALFEELVAAGAVKTSRYVQLRVKAAKASPASEEAAA